LRSTKPPRVCALNSRADALSTCTRLMCTVWTTHGCTLSHFAPYIFTDETMPVVTSELWFPTLWVATVMFLSLDRQPLNCDMTLVWHVPHVTDTHTCMKTDMQRDRQMNKTLTNTKLKLSAITNPTALIFYSLHVDLFPTRAAPFTWSRCCAKPPMCTSASDLATFDTLQLIIGSSSVCFTAKNQC